MKRWYIVEQSESHIVGEGYQVSTTDKIYAEYLLRKLNKQRELKMIDFTPVMREATVEETALLNFDLDMTIEEETLPF